MLTFWGGDIPTFGVVYVVGELCLLVGSLFLSGPKSQLKSMFESTDHTIASVAWLGCLVAILLVVILMGEGAGTTILTLVLVVVEKIAYLWYTLAFFPGGHYAAKAMVQGMLAGCCGGS